jgi:hypothetical protein
VSSRTDLVAALARAHFDAVLGTPESDWLDFKSQPYSLDGSNRLSASGKWNLAKDIACFANSAGGLIVIGYKTQKLRNAIVEEAVSHNPVPKNRVDADAYSQAPADWIYPLVQGISYRWFPPERGHDSGALVIDVPPQADRDRPFFVRRTVESTTGTVDSWSASSRQGDRCVPLPIERIHADVVSGRHLGMAAQAQRFEDAAQRLEDLVRMTASALSGERDGPILAIEAVNPTAIPMNGFYDASAGARPLLAHPPALRAHGFNLSHEGNVTVDSGAFVVGWSGTAVRAEPDGSYCAVAAATANFLGWAMDQVVPRPRGLRLNPLAVVEFVYEAVRLGFELVDLGGVPPTSLQWRLVAQGLQSNQVELQPGPHRSFALAGTSQASSDDWRKDFQAVDLEHTAFVALEQFYALFGHGPDAIPYAQGQRVDPSAIVDAS